MAYLIHINPHTYIEISSEIIENYVLKIVQVCKMGMWNHLITVCYSDSDWLTQTRYTSIHQTGVSR